MDENEARFFADLSNADTLTDLWRVICRRLWPMREFKIIKPIEYRRTQTRSNYSVSNCAIYSSQEAYLNDVRYQHQLANYQGLAMQSLHANSLARQQNAANANGLLNALGGLGGNYGR